MPSQENKPIETFDSFDELFHAPNSAPATG